MRFGTAMNHRDRLLGLAREVYSLARISASTHEGVLAQTRRYSEDPAWAKVPGWVRARVIAETDMLAQRMYQPGMHEAQLAKVVASGDMSGVPFLRWQLRLDGEHVTSDDIGRIADATPDNDSRVAVWSRVEGAHVWNHRPDRPYSPWARLGS